MRFSDFAKNYDDFVAPNFKIKCGNEELLNWNVEVANFSVSLSASKSDHFSVTLNNPCDPADAKFLFSRDEYRALIQVGQSADVEIGYGDRLLTVFAGTVENVTTDFPADGQPQVTVSGYDKSKQMMKNAKFKRFKDKTCSQVVTEIAREGYGFSGPNLQVKATDVAYKELVQHNETDYEFVKGLAEKNNCEFFVSGGRFVFRDRQAVTSPLVTLVWSESLISFSSETNLASQVKEVTVSGWNEAAKEKVEATVTVFDIGLPDDLAKVINDNGAAKRFSTKASTQEEARKEAEAILTDLASGLLTGKGSCLGLPDIAVGEFLELEGLSQEFNGRYYLTDVTHNISTGGYKTQFDIRRSAK